MNNKYTYLNGNVILKGRDGNEFTTPNTDNMYDVVKQENYIEIIENKINKVQDNIYKNKINIEKDNKIIKFSLIASFLVPIFSGIAEYIMYSLISIGDTSTPEMLNHFVIKIMNILNLNSFEAYVGIATSIAFAIISYPIGIIISSICQNKKKKLKRQLTGKSKELEYLKAKKEEAQNTLEELKSKSQEIPLEEQPQENKIIDVNNDLDYIILNQEQINAYNEGIAEYQTLSRVRRNHHK